MANQPVFTQRHKGKSKAQMESRKFAVSFHLRAFA
jgi:hypothetical protein